MSEYQVGDFVQYKCGDNAPSFGEVVGIHGDHGLLIHFSEGKFADGADYYCNEWEWLSLVDRAEPIDRVIDEDVPAHFAADSISEIAWPEAVGLGHIHGRNDVCLKRRSGPRCDKPEDYVDEPTAEEFDEAARALDERVDLTNVDLSLVYLAPRRVVALREATKAFFHQTAVGVLPQQSEILAMARFLLDEEFVVGRVEG